MEIIDPRSDSELILELNQRDELAFEALYYRHRDWVVDTACRHAGDLELASDVLQDSSPQVRGGIRRHN